jgi:uncharacterized membrane protein
MTKHRYADTVKYRAEKENERRRAQTVTHKQIGGVAAAAGILTAGIGICVSSAALTVAGAVVAVGGILVAVTDSSKK